MERMITSCLRTMLDTREFRQTRVWFISTFSPSRRAIILQLNAVSNNNTSILVLLYRERLTIPNQMIPEPHFRNQRIALVGLLV